MPLYRMPVQIYCEEFIIAYSETGDERYLDYLVEDTLLKEEKKPNWEYGVTNYDVDGEGAAGQTRFAKINGQTVKSHIVQTPAGCTKTYFKRYR